MAALQVVWARPVATSERNDRDADGRNANDEMATTRRGLGPSSQQASETTEM